MKFGVAVAGDIGAAAARLFVRGQTLFVRDSTHFPPSRLLASTLGVKMA